jgi:hypothetical protein
MSSRHQNTTHVMTDLPALAGLRAPSMESEHPPATTISRTLEVIDSVELAKRLSVPETWIRSRSNRKRTTDPIPHYRLGRYIRFSWGSVELNDWLARQLVSTDGVWSRRKI